MNRPLLLGWASTVLAMGSLWPTQATAQMDAQTVDLRPHMVQGQASRYHVWSLRRQTQSVTVGTQSHEFHIRFEIEGEVTWTVQRVRADGRATCAMTLDWMTAKLTGPDSPAQYSDSRRSRGEPEAIHGLLVAMTGVPIAVEVGADGSILTVSGIDSIRRHAPADAQVPDELDFIESASELATIANAARAVPIHGWWDAQFMSNHQLGKIRQSMRYTLDSVEEIAGIPVATVTGVGQLRLEPNQDRLRQTARGLGVDIQARMTSGQVHTQIMFDLQRHEAVGRDTIEDRRIEIHIRGAQQAVSRTIDEKIHSQILRVEEQ